MAHGKSLLCGLQLLCHLPTQSLVNDVVSVKLNLVHVSALNASTSCCNTFASAIPVSRKSHSVYEKSLFQEVSNKRLPVI